MNEELMKKEGFAKEVERVRANLCPVCGVAIQPGEYRDDLSVKEAGISGMCQKCQDRVFGGWAD